MAPLGDPGGSPLPVYISNISEDVWPFISLISPTARRTEIAENAFLSDRDLLTCGHHQDCLLILPHAVEPVFLDYVQHLFGQKQVEVLVPQKHSGQICLDILSDARIMRRLLTLGRSRRLELLSYSSSYQFLRLATELEKVGLRLTTPESPLRENYWTSNFFGSKAGFRQMVWRYQARNSDLKMTEGFISFGLANIAKIAAARYQQNGGVVIKTSKGHSGMGMLIFSPGSLPTGQAGLPAATAECESAIGEKLAAEPYWAQLPAVIEDFVTIDRQVGGGNPNGEFFINSQGQVEFLYTCGMRVTQAGVFKGVEIHQHVLPADIVTRIKKVGETIGQIYSAHGYRGYFDLDCVVSTQGELLLTESNVRKTGGTHVYQTIKTLLGNSFARDYYTLSNNVYNLPGRRNLNFSQLLTLLKPILFDPTKKEGIILAAANLLKSHQLAYLIIGRDQTKALQLEKQLEKLLK